MWGECLLWRFNLFLIFNWLTTNPPAYNIILIKKSHSVVNCVYLQEPSLKKTYGFISSSCCSRSFLRILISAVPHSVLTCSQWGRFWSAVVVLMFGLWGAVILSLTIKITLMYGGRSAFSLKMRSGERGNYFWCGPVGFNSSEGTHIKSRKGSGSHSNSRCQKCNAFLVEAKANVLNTSIFGGRKKQEHVSSVKWKIISECIIQFRSIQVNLCDTDIHT